MMNRLAKPSVLTALLPALLFALSGCAKPGSANAKRTNQPRDNALAQQNGAEADQSAGDKSSPLACSASDSDCKKYQEIAILAGGCFWGMEELLRTIPGMLHTEVGYSGGILSSPTYEDVKQGSSGHAESVRVIFDNRKLKYDTLLERWFFRMHDPTTENRQGNDRGTQYRSAIFYTSPAQRTTALAVIKRVEKSGKWSESIVTEVSEAGPFTLAEDYHQDYLQKNPGGYTCHFMRN